MWKKHPDYDCEVSFMGQVRSTITGKILSAFENKGRGQKKYIRVTVRKNKKPIKEYVHRLVAQTFLDRPHGKNQVDHIDGDTKNNSLDNLQWVDGRENVRKAYGWGEPLF